jgi:GNAT superfamily N-acetyltransferase
MLSPSLRSALKHELVIRPYFASDYDHAYRIIRAIGEVSLGANLRVWDELFDYPSGYVWSAVIGGIPVGFAAMDCYENGTMVFHTDVIDPAFQRQGIGTAMVLARMAMLDASHISTVALLATESSKPFYERFGFTVQGQPSYDAIADYFIHSMSRPFDEEASEEANQLIANMRVEMRLEEVDPNPRIP